MIKELVGQVEVREVRVPPAVMSVIAHQKEIRPAHAVLVANLLDDLADQLIGAGDGPAGDAELTPAPLVADRIRLRQPNDRHRLFVVDQMALRVMNVRIVDVIICFVHVEKRHDAHEASAPQDRRHLGHHRQCPRRPVAAVVSQMGKQRRDSRAGAHQIAGLRILPLEQPHRVRLRIVDHLVNALRREQPGTAVRSQGFQIGLAVQASSG